MDKKIYQMLCDNVDKDDWRDLMFEHNTFVYEDDYWFGVVNVKYATMKRDHLTFFVKRKINEKRMLWDREIIIKESLQDFEYPGYNYYINDPIDRSVGRLHFHLTQHDIKVSNGRVTLLTI